jgi:murein DD-endopeptidase MepM/ murein hydrolase activator NlpD
MIDQRLARLRQTAAGLFPERHLYVRSGGEMHKFVLSQKRQMMIASVAAGVAVWSLLATSGIIVNSVQLALKDQAVAREKARAADRQRRLEQAMRELNSTEGGVKQLAQSVESRHQALAMVIAELQGGSAAATPPPVLRPAASADPVLRVQSVRQDQERLLAQAESLAKTRAERLRLAFRMAGLNPANFTGSRRDARGGPLVEARDPRALAAVLDVDEDFARRVQRASANLGELRRLSAAADTLPFNKPTQAGYRTSNFGVRFDPFTDHPAFHAGVDFAGGLMTPVLATAPGVVSYAGVRSGYGNTVEVDHGSGLKTRYAHLHQIGVRPGQRVAVGQRVGGMGTTGRSTGVHLHYEVWMNGRVQNPDRFLKAGQHVQQSL